MANQLNQSTQTVLAASSHPLHPPANFQADVPDIIVPAEMQSNPITCSTTVNGKLWLDENHFVILDSEGAVVNRTPHTPVTWWEDAEGETRKLPGRTLVLGAFGDYHYYHWLLDALPKLGMVELIGDSIENFDNIVFREATNAFHTETLEVLGVKKEQICETKQQPKMICDEIVDLQMSNLVGMTMPRAVPNYLKSKFLGSNRETLTEGEHLYIGRPKKLQRRSVSNEDEVISLLSEYGFRHLEMENYSVREQAELFNQAKSIVTPHGGALANLVFCEPGTQVIELFANHVFSYFYGLANLCDLKYAAVLKNPEQHNLVVDPMAGNEVKNQHITSTEPSIPVDIKDLAACLEGLGYEKLASAA